MKRIRVITCLLTAALVAATFAGCSEVEVKTVDTSKQLGQEQQAPQKERGTIAKVVSLDGDRLTVILSDMPGGDRGGGTPPTEGAAPNGGTPPEGSAPQDAGNGQAAASGAAIGGTGAPGSPDQQVQQDQPGQPRQGGGEIQFTGEEATYTLSGDVTVTKGIGDTAAEIDLSELAVDDVIRFTTITGDDGNEVIDSIVVME